MLDEPKKLGHRYAMDVVLSVLIQGGERERGRGID